MGRILAVAFALAASPAIALAQNPGINLAWNACFSEGGVTTRTSSCLSNSGTNLLVGSFVPAYDMPSFVGIEATLQVYSTDPTLPDWWQLQSGACRQTSMTAIVQFYMLPGTACVDPFSNQGVGLADYTTPFLGRTDAARVRVVGAIPYPSPVSAGTEYYAFILSISNNRTIGTGACAGCDVGTCIALGSIKLVGNDYSEQVLDNPIQSNVAIYQCGFLGIADGPGGGGAVCVRDQNCYTATANRSWGQIKSLYR